MSELITHYTTLTTAQEREAACQGFVTHLRTLIADTVRHDPLVDMVILSDLAQVSTDCGAMVSLGKDYNAKKFNVIKTYLHEDGDWLLPKNALRQLQTSMKFHSYANSPKSLQPCVDVKITKNATNLYFPFYPLTFNALFNPQRTPPTAFVLEKAIELLYAVCNLHDVGIAHRDIKGANICFDENCALVLIDFDSSVTENLNHRKTVPVCTLETRAPEQIRLELASSTNKQETKDTVVDEYYSAKNGDWWAVGCVIAQMFLGAPLFRLRDINWTLRDYYEDICTFCAHLANHKSSLDGNVKALRRCVSPDILELLCALLNFKEDARYIGVVEFLKKIN